MTTSSPAEQIAVFAPNTRPACIAVLIAFVVSLLIAVIAGLQAYNRTYDSAPSEEIAAIGDGECDFRPNYVGSGCGFSRQGALRMEMRSFIGPHGPVPFTYIRQRGSTPRRFLVRLIGGPRETTFRVWFPEPRYRFPEVEDQDVGVIIPAYLGTGDRSHYPSSDVGPAAEEVVGMIQRLRWSNPKAEIAVVAESAGALVGLEVARRIRIPLVLVAPSPTSLQDLFTRPAGTDMPLNVATQIVHFVRVGPSGRSEVMRVPLLDSVSTFAGADFDLDLVALIERLPPPSRACLAIVHGAEDRRVHVREMSRVRARFPTIPIRALPGMDHAPRNLEELTTFREAIRRATPEYCF